jgi:hypothetical protein
MIIFVYLVASVHKAFLTKNFIMRKKIAFLLFISLSFYSIVDAQNSVSAKQKSISKKHVSRLEMKDDTTVKYTGPKIDLNQYSYDESLYFSILELGALKTKEAFQGMAIYGDMMFSLHNTGICTVIDLTHHKLLSEFNLASYGKTNHANVASFGKEFYSPEDEFPLLYVSQVWKERVNNMKDVCYVERVTKNSSELVQTINYKDEKGTFGYALQWVVDVKNGYLYGFGNTIKNAVEGNKHQITKFKLPKLSDSDSNKLVTLTEDDIVEAYTLEDYYNGSEKLLIGQGLTIFNGKLFMPTGFGNATYPASLWVVDLDSRRVSNVIDLSYIKKEPEDCDVYQGSLIIQCNGGNVYKFTF